MFSHVILDEKDVVYNESLPSRILKKINLRSIKVPEQKSDDFEEEIDLLYLIPNQDISFGHLILEDMFWLFNCYLVSGEPVNFHVLPLMYFNRFHKYVDRWIRICKLFYPNATILPKDSRVKCKRLIFVHTPSTTYRHHRISLRYTFLKFVKYTQATKQTFERKKEIHWYRKSRTRLLREVVNQEEVQNTIKSFFPMLELKVIYPKEHSLEEQWRLVQTASVIVAPMGNVGCLVPFSPFDTIIVTFEVFENGWRHLEREVYNSVPHQIHYLRLHHPHGKIGYFNGTVDVNTIHQVLKSQVRVVKNGRKSYFVRAKNISVLQDRTCHFVDEVKSGNFQLIGNKDQEESNRKVMEIFNFPEPTETHSSLKDGNDIEQLLFIKKLPPYFWYDILLRRKC